VAKGVDDRQLLQFITQCHRLVGSLRSIPDLTHPRLASRVVERREFEVSIPHHRTLSERLFEVMYTIDAFSMQKRAANALLWNDGTPETFNCVQL
jgi:hypothetical protein